jgi:cell filamentation protein
MTNGGYAAFDDPYCYTGTAVLKNRLGTRDSAVLESFELEMTTLRAEEPLPNGRLGPAHYRAIHRHLFQDVYSWAGRYRTVRTGKGGNWFCYPEHIPQQMDTLFGELRANDYLASDGFESFVQGAAEFLAGLNAIHPFREGNGRSQLAFMHLLSARAGYPLDFARVDPPAFLEAMIASFAGDTAPLAEALTKLRRD